MLVNLAVREVHISSSQDDAVAIYRGAGRHDLVNRIYQAQGKWMEAFELADKLDRIHLRNT